jgi:PIN domain nuclease of toxin-antitoxin system
VTVLLDTSPLLWTLADPDRLSTQAREAIDTGLATLSVVSYWEVVIKTRSRSDSVLVGMPDTAEQESRKRIKSASDPTNSASPPSPSPSGLS